MCSRPCLKAQVIFRIYSGRQTVSKSKSTTKPTDTKSASSRAVVIMPRATHTKRDRVYIALLQMDSDEPFQVGDLHELIKPDDDDEEQSTVSTKTIRDVLTTLRYEGLVEHTDDGKHFVRNF